MKSGLIIACISCLLVAPLSAEIIYVDNSATGANDGSSWTNAYTALQDALMHADAAEKPAEINVAQGVYKPDQGESQVPGDKHATFQLIDGITLKGGFAGLGQTDPNARDLHNFTTILHGDLADDDGPDFSQYHNNSQTIVASTHNENTAVLDGFTITGGFGWSGPAISCYDSNALFLDCTITHNKSAGREGGYGGGMFISGGSPTLIDCVFNANWALADGGAIWCQGRSSPNLSGCRFKNNVASVGGGLSVASDAVITNCLFENNEAQYGAGLASRYGGHPVLNNCTFYGNQSLNGASLSIGYLARGTAKNCILWNDGKEIVHDEDSSFDITYSNIKNGWPGQGNISVEPLFATPGLWVHGDDSNMPVEPNDPNAVWKEGDYHLKSQAGHWFFDPTTEPNAEGESWVLDDVTSPCIDAGDPNSLADLEPCPNGNRINMGAYGQTPEASRSTTGLLSGTRQYSFIADQSTLVQTGGFAGVHWTHAIEGQFTLNVDLDTCTASFSLMDADAMNPEFPDHVLDPNTALNMTGLTGTINQDGSVSFLGQAANEVTVDLRLTLQEDMLHLVGFTTPPPGSADFFILELDAMASPIGNNRSGTSDGD